MPPVNAVRRAHAAAAILLAAAALWLLLPSPARAAGTETQVTYDTPQHAVEALVAALRADQPRQVVKILGPAGRPLVFSGDAVADRQGREQFVAAYDQANRIDMQGAARAVLVIGEKQWPFPIPLVKDGVVWRFDTAAGAQEILDRRIGRNELSAIETCRAYVDAQRDYAATVHRSDGLLAYAQHFMSSPGKRDGLYWPPVAGEPESPMGPLVAAARAEGYTPGEKTEKHHSSYHGYFYRILKGQGPHAADGARDYLVDGNMIGGFALVAFPGRWGDSGVMTFIVNQDGVVYQKNLGPDTEATARKMKLFDPDSTWTVVPPAEKP
jgi:Protein of unknown function (DUF2950)